MLDRVRRSTFDALLPAALAAMVFAFSCGSSSVATLTQASRIPRWGVLFGVCALALGAAAGGGIRISRRLMLVAAAPMVFVALAFLSVGWSIRPFLSFERAVSLGVLLVTATAVAVWADARPERSRAALAGLASGAVTVGLVGVAMLAVGVNAAHQSGGAQTGWRFQGLGQNPNTIAVLSAVALPLITWLFVTARRRGARRWWSIGWLVLVGSSVASESRGGLVALLVGVGVVILLAVEGRTQKSLGMAVLVAVTVAGLVLRHATQPSIAPFVSAVQPGGIVTTPITTPSTGVHTGKPKGPVPLPKGTPKPRHIFNFLPRRADEIGHPSLSTVGPDTVGSGRLAAWKGALKLVRERPLLGYGFGTESSIFVDRWYAFQGSRTENSVLGVLLELGSVGLLALVAAFVTILWVGISRLRRRRREGGHLAATLGLAAAALFVAFIQSYIYSVGNLATAVVWVGVFLVAASPEVQR